MGQGERMKTEDLRTDILAIAIGENAVAYDRDSDAFSPKRQDPGACKPVYVKAFQAWADGKIAGEAEEVFETVKEVLESPDSFSGMKLFG